MVLNKFDDSISNKVIDDTACPSCVQSGRDKTGNHLMIFDNGSAYCNRCGYAEQNYSGYEEEGSDSVVTRLHQHTSPITVEDINQLPIKDLPDRLIKQSTCEYFNVHVSLSESNGSTITHHYYPIYKDGEFKTYKSRSTADKSFSFVSSCKDQDLFGQHLVPAEGKKIYITEGELDCLTLWQCLKERMSSGYENINPPVVSLQNGIASAKNELARHYNYLDSFDEVVFVFDNDEAGKKGLEECCSIFPSKAKSVSLSHKDPSDMYVAGLGDDLKWACIKHAVKYQPDSIVNGKDAWEYYQQSKVATCLSYPKDWTELNQKTYGPRLGEIITIASGSGCGKTQFMREIKYHLFNTTDYNIADIALEEGVGDTVQGMMALQLNKRIHLPDVKVTEDEEKEAFNYLYNNNRWSLYDHFGGLDDDNLFSKLRYFAATGHKLIFIDHLSIIVSEYAAKGNERERIDTIMTKLAKLAKELDVCIFIIVHLKKTDNGSTSFENGAVPTLDDLRGSGSLKQLSWDVIVLSRNQQDTNPELANTSTLTVLKCRFSGRTGTADKLFFNESTGRMIKVQES